MKIFILLICIFIITACGTIGSSTRRNKKAMPINLLANSTFSKGKENWNPWQYASKYSNLVQVVTYDGQNGKYKVLRIENPYAKLIGLNQAVKVEAGKIYELSAAARSTITNSSAILFGARVGLRLPHQREYCLLWMTEFNDWWKKKCIITNKFTGTAVVYVDMGYGNVVSTGEFADVRLEMVVK